MKSVKFAGVFLFTLGFIMATGVDVNPWQAVYALVLMTGALVCSKVHKRMEKGEKNDRTISGVMRDAA